MKEFSRPATQDDLRSLLKSLNDQGAEYLLIGGYALAAHGYQRATTDIDVMVPANADAGALVKKALMVLPDQAAAEIDPQWFDEGENIRVADAFVVDIMLNANGQTYETLKQFKQTIDWDGIPVNTVSLEGLLLTKKTMREKDVADRLIIERALEVLRAQRGFTMIELIMVIVILGVLAVFAAPMFNATMFNARGFHDETLSLLRHAQKSAIAQRRTVCVAFTSTSVSLSMAANPATADCSTSTALSGPSGESVVRAKSGVSFVSVSPATHPTNFNFDGLGQPITGAVDANGVPIAMGKQTIKINDATDIVVESITGYVHD